MRDYLLTVQAVEASSYHIIHNSNVDKQNSNLNLAQQWFEELGSIDNLVFGEGSRGASKGTGGSIAFSLIKIAEDVSVDLGNGKGHFWRLKKVFWKLKSFEKWEEK